MRNAANKLQLLSFCPFSFPILLKREYRQSIAFLSSVTKSIKDSLQIIGPSFCII